MENKYFGRLKQYYDDFWNNNFDNVTTEYSRFFLQEKNDLISKFLKVSNDDIVLDIGCGSGLSFISCPSKSRIRVGIDISFVCLKSIRNLRSDVNFINSLAEDIPFKSCSIDKIICAELMEHVIDDEQILKEINRILKPGGTVVFDIPNGYSFFYWPKRILRLLLAKCGIIKRYNEEETYFENIGNVAHLRRYSKKTFIKRLVNNGFRVYKCVGLFIDNGDRLNNLVKILSNNYFFYYWATSISKVFPTMGLKLMVVCKKC